MVRREDNGSEAVMSEATAEKLWTVSECARFLQMSVSWVYKQVGANAIPHAHLGSRLRFHPQRIREYAQTIGANDGARAKVIPLRKRTV
jgi:predicted DNA-binding transcriptional regulator AlpA